VSVAEPTFALLGSGEFEPWSEAVDRWMLRRATGDGRILVMPTASAPEGDAVFDRWATMGIEHFASLGLAAEVLPVKTRDDAGAPEMVGLVDGASVVYVSGGNPAYLADTLTGTPLWAAIVGELGRGMAYAGCSAGIACLGEVAPDSAADPAGGRVLQPGLRLFPKTFLGPHWDALDRFVPGLRAFIEASVPLEDTLLAVDERTAAVGDGSAWSVLGAGAVSVRRDGMWQTFGAGSSFDATLTFREAIESREP
jgi:cyanophycinase